MTSDPLPPPDAGQSEAAIRKISLKRRIAEWSVVAAILGILVLLLMPATRSVRPAARRSQCRNNLKQIGLALHNYYDRYGSFPPAYTTDGTGRRLHSWRTLILPFIDQESLYECIDLSKPWDDPDNEQARKTFLACYSCPGQKIDGTKTSYLGVAVPGGTFASDRGMKLEDIPRDHSRTTLVIDVDGDDLVEWMSPRDADQAVINRIVTRQHLPHTGGIQILNVDGSARFVPLPDEEADFRENLQTTGEPVSKNTASGQESSQ